VNNGVCPICEVWLPQSDRVPSDDWEPFNCLNCGRFGISGSLLAQSPRAWEGSRRARAVLSHAVRRMQRGTKPPLLEYSLVKQVLDADDLPSPAEQVDLLLVQIGDKQGAPGEHAEIYLDMVRAAIGAQSAPGVQWAILALHEAKLAQTDQAAGPKQVVSLTFSGWQRYHTLRQGRPESRRAFMAMQYGDAQLEQLYEATLKPATEKTGFKLVRLDEAPPAGLIDVRLRAELRRARFLLADLTHANPGAYWEAGFMEGLGRPVIYLCRADAFNQAGTHFDTNHSHHVLWDTASADKCARDLIATIRATLPSEARMED
jgi:nucleoside 2-deoxyribosyltransferase